MKLSEFVTQTLEQINEGVVTAQGAVEAMGGVVNPVINHSGAHLRCDVEFDVALTTVESGERSGGIQVYGVGGKVSKVDSSSSVSRIRFTVPMTLPPTEDTPPSGRRQLG